MALRQQYVGISNLQRPTAVVGAKTRLLPVPPHVLAFYAVGPYHGSLRTRARLYLVVWSAMVGNIDRVGNRFWQLGPTTCYQRVMWIVR
jgi:hypothetical protein